MSDSALASRPHAPVAFAELSVRTSDSSVAVVLSGDGVRSGRVIGADPAAHVDPESTAWAPRAIRGEGQVAELVGYRLSQHEDPGDTVVTYALLLEASAPGVGPVRAVWFENHMEVPTRLYAGEGRLGPAKGGAQALQLTVTDADGESLAIDGLIRLR